MKTLKTILKFIAIFIALILIIAIFVDGDFSYEKTVKIDAPIDNVWEHTNSLAGLNSWSPWVAKDPEAQQSMSGTDGTVGAQACWDSTHEEVGKGCQTISKIQAPNLLETELNFERPRESEATGTVKLVKVDGGTEVTWGFSSTMPYPFRVMKLVMSLEDAIGEEFTNGLNKLKTLSEN